jgi:3-dehydroquinate synthase
MVAFQLDRKSCVIALGGGVISDLAGFASACYMRGIDLINIPTTLLGMVDASMGGKTGINLPEGKNLIGCFHHAKYIFVCPSFLQTLPEREYCAGLAEVIKYGVIRDPLFFSFLEENMESILNKSPDKLKSLIFRCCEIKSQVIQEDPEDKNDIRAVLNWGHTFAHAIEAAKGYREILHGEAVAIGMSCAASVSEHLGYAKPEFIERQDRLLKKAKLKIAIPNISYDQLLNFMQKDKKNKSGRISLIVAEKIGKVFKHPDVDMNNIKEALRKKETRIH